jgi:hypothetical protein
MTAACVIHSEQQNKQNEKREATVNDDSKNRGEGGLGTVLGESPSARPDGQQE